MVNFDKTPILILICLVDNFTVKVYFLLGKEVLIVLLYILSTQWLFLIIFQKNILLKLQVILLLYLLISASKAYILRFHEDTIYDISAFDNTLLIRLS